MPVYEISHFKGGISDNEDRGIKGAYKFTYNNDVHSDGDSFKAGQALTNITDVFTDLVRFLVKSNDGNVYGFGNTGKVYKITSGLVASVVYDHAAAIKGAAEWYSDAGKTYLYFASDTGLHRKELPGLSDWTDVDAGADWPKTNLTSADWHTMRECGGSLVIANASLLALVGYDDSYTNEALQLIPGNIAKTLVERSGRTIIGTVPADDPTKGVNASIDCEVPLAQIGDDGEIFYANMSDSIPAKRFPGGGKVNPGGVNNKIISTNIFEWDQTALSWIDKQSVGSLSLWGVFAATEGYGGVYSYGRAKKDKPFILNLDYLLDVDEIGAVIRAHNTTLVSYKDGSTYGVKKIDASNKATAVYEGLDFKAPVKRPINVTNFKYAELFLDPLPAGCAIEFYYRVNKDGAFVQALTADGNTQFTTTGETEVVFFIGADGNTYEPRIKIIPYGNYTPEIHRLRTYFE